MQGQLVAAVPSSDRWLVSLSNGESLRVRPPNLSSTVALGSLYICGGSCSSDLVSSTEVFNIRTGLFEERAEAMARPRFHMCTAVVGGHIYAFGGFDGSSTLRTAERLDAARGTWEQLPPMSLPRAFACSAVVGGMIYVAGGCLSGEAGLASAERFSPARRCWQQLPSMTQARAFSVGAAVAGRHFLVCGGHDQDLLTSTECFVPADGPAGRWRELPRMHFSAIFMARATDEAGNLYLCGGATREAPDGLGRRSLRFAQRFHGKQGRWQLLPPMLMERSGAIAGDIGAGRICVCGGFGFDSMDKRTVECYNPSINAWSFLAPMHEPRSYFMSHVAGGRLYVFGGRVGSDILRSGECYYISKRIWERLPPMSVPRTGAAVDLV